MELEYGAYSIKGFTHQINEDRYRLLGNSIDLVKQTGAGQIFAVFDGMGSAPKGGQAAQRMCDCLLDFFTNEDIAKNVPGLERHLFKVNEEIKAWGHIAGSKKELGACAGTVAWFSDNGLTLFHAGDTFALLLKADSAADSDYEILTTEHAIGNGIYRYFGIGNSLQIEVKGFHLAEGDILLLISDGVVKSLGFSTIAANIRQNVLRSQEHAAQELCRLAKIRGSSDDITALVVEVVDL